MRAVTGVAGGSIPVISRNIMLFTMWR